MATSSREDGYYGFDTDAMATLSSPKSMEVIRANVQYYNTCRVSVLAAMKMLKHALAGVAEGRQVSGMPFEIMGLLLGKPEGREIIITDAFPLPVKGVETKVEASDEANQFMTNLLDVIESKRKDAFVGWYHSHPFDVESQTHCHLSETDTATQTSWQFYSPRWVALVVDPLRSLMLQRPEIGAYRTYPPAHSVPKDLMPDGTTNTDDSSAKKRWGAVPHRYYEMSLSYFNSSLSSRILNSMTESSLWAKVLTSGNRDVDAENATTRLLNQSATAISQINHDGSLAKDARQAARSPTTTSSSSSTPKIADVSDKLTTHAVGACCNHATQIMKAAMFLIQKREPRSS